MSRRAWSVLTLTLAAFSLAPSLAHVLEAPPRLRDWPPELWMETTVFHGQFTLFQAIGAPVDVLAILAAVVLAFLLRRSAGFRWAATGAVLLGIALGAWFTLVAPANAILATWRPGPIPVNFVEVRDRWETGHAVVALLKACAFVTLAASVTGAMRPR
jgi:hypothetical protein